MLIVPVSTLVIAVAAKMLKAFLDIKIRIYKIQAMKIGVVNPTCMYILIKQLEMV